MRASRTNADGCRCEPRLAARRFAPLGRHGDDKRRVGGHAYTGPPALGYLEGQPTQRGAWESLSEHGVLWWRKMAEVCAVSGVW